LLDPGIQSVAIGSTHGLQPIRWSALAWVVLLLALAALKTLSPFWLAIVLAAWASTIARPIHQACDRVGQKRKSLRLRPGQGAAALVTVLLSVAFLVPIAIAVLSLSASAIELGQRLLKSESGAEALKLLAAQNGASFDFRAPELSQLFELARQHGTSALSVAETIFGAATVVVVGSVVFVSAFYTFLVHGADLSAWLTERSPLSRGDSHRLSNVFSEVGRGLIIGVGLTAVLQGAAATIGYLALGVPQPLVLGLVTVFASLIPSVGAGLVWAPVSAGLLIAGRPGAAVVMLVIGCVVSLLDNVVRPLLTRYGELRLHGLLLFIAMLGGMATFGASGVLLGPLFVRLAIEGLSMLREQREKPRLG
jgi:predicted PurR-regulated permease PerM